MVLLDLLMASANTTIPHGASDLCGTVPEAKIVAAVAIVEIAAATFIPNFAKMVLSLTCA